MAPQYLPSFSSEKKKEFIDSFDTVVSDCDGVIWRPEGVIQGAPEVINELIKCGKRVYFITNNSTKTRDQFYAKVQKYGFNVPPENLYNTSSLVAQYLQQNLPSDKVVYVVGPPAIALELDARKVKHFGVGKDELYDDFFENVNNLKIDMKENVGAVAIGFDQYISYVKMLKAVTYLRNKECLFVCTNTDEVFPTQSKIVLPGTGSIVAGIQVASGREPFVVGKPSTYIAEALKYENEINPKRTLFIGDRCNTDIRMGNLCSFSTLLVLSGVHTIADVQKYESSPKAEDQQSVPQYYTDSIFDLCIT